MIEDRLPVHEDATRRDLARRVILHALRAQLTRSLEKPVEKQYAAGALATELAEDVLNDLDRPFLYPALRALTE